MKNSNQKSKDLSNISQERDWVSILNKVIESYGFTVTPREEPQEVTKTYDVKFVVKK